MLANIIRKNIRSFSYLMGVSFLVTSAFVLLKIFFKAYFTTDQQIIFSINHFNEANIELGLMLIAMPFLFYICFDVFKNVLPKIKRGEL